MGRKKDITRIYDVKDKIRNVQYYIDLSLNRTLSMFKYNNLPDSLPEVELEKVLQVNGYGIITEHEGNLIALWGGWAPPMDVYYRYKKIIVNNPWAKINKEYTFGEDCVLIKNDPLCKGLLPLFKRYGTYLTEADITLYLAMLNFRSIYNISVSSDDEKDSAELFLKHIEEGTQGVMVEDDFSQGIKTNPYSASASGYITQIIELEQYLKGSFFNDIGLNANYNMKRERLNSSEVELNEDGLRPLIDSMLEERQKFLEQVNKKYGTNITVEFNSSWSQYNEDADEVEDDTNDDIPNSDSIDSVDSTNDVNEEVQEDVQEEVTNDTIQEDTQDEETNEDSQDSEESEEETNEDTTNNSEVEEVQEDVQEVQEETPSVEVNVTINTDEVQEVNNEINEEVQEEVNDEVDEEDDDNE